MKIGKSALLRLKISNRQRQYIKGFPHAHIFDIDDNMNIDCILCEKCNNCTDCYGCIECYNCIGIQNSVKCVME